MVKITETSLRDGHQSLIATRLTTPEILGIVEKMDKVGYHALEVWGGATFDACIRFLDEDPWERLRLIRSKVKNTKLQMLLRGQNLLGYKHYSDEIVEHFIQKSIENGIDIIRVFDALNDIRNLEASVKAIKKYGGHAQIALSYSTSPIHTVDFYAKMAKEVEELGADSICIKDMSGILLPNDGYELIKKIKEATNLQVELHTHATSGISEVLYMKAIEAGVDIIDTAISPFAGGTSQPATEAMQYMLQNTKDDPKLDLDLLNEVADYFTPIRDAYLASGVLNPKALMVNPNILKYQVPGGMLSNLLGQLVLQNASDKYEEVLREIPRVRADLGYPPLVTPLSQMVGTQAVMNVITGERYKMVPKEIKDYVKGLYGASPLPIDPKIQKLIIGDEEVITHRPADDIDETFSQYQEAAKDYAKSDEDVLTYAMFPEVATAYFKKRDNKEQEFIFEINVHL